MFTDHHDLPGSEEGQREVALAVNHMAPTCQAFADAMLDAVVSDQIGLTEDALGIAAWAAGRKLDKFVPSPWDVLTDKKRGSP
jgi:2-hydroxychromene-2-carboxylate isomerase